MGIRQKKKLGGFWKKPRIFKTQPPILSTKPSPKSNLFVTEPNLSTLLFAAFVPPLIPSSLPSSWVPNSQTRHVPSLPNSLFAVFALACLCYMYLHQISLCPSLSSLLDLSKSCVFTLIICFRDSLLVSRLKFMNLVIIFTARRRLTEGKICTYRWRRHFLSSY